jgi:CO/xanthine dehydrogenase FAD-binding subunit
MRSYLPSFELRRASSVADALATLAQEPGAWRPFAGGTDLMVLLEAGALEQQRRFVSLWGIQELRGVQRLDDGMSIGALTTYTDLLNDRAIQTEFPLLCDAASQTGGVATQNRGTIGGNIANASPAADTPPALLVYDAELELVSIRGTRRVPYHRFHTGYKTADLRPDELIARVHLPRRSSAWTDTYRKVGTRKAQAIAKVCFAAGARVAAAGQVEDIRIAFGSVGPTVVRATTAERALRGSRLDETAIDAALAALAGDIRPIDDMRSTARYRGFVARQLLLAFLHSLRDARREPS